MILYISNKKNTKTSRFLVYKCDDRIYSPFVDT